MRNETNILALVLAASLVALPAKAQDASAAISPSDVSSSIERVVDTQIPAEDAVPAQANADSVEMAPGLDFTITSEQVAQIRQIVAEADVASAETDLDVALGIAIPASVTLSPIPRNFAAIVPRLNGYLYFVLPDTSVVIVSSNTLTVMVILRP